MKLFVFPLFIILFACSNSPKDYTITFTRFGIMINDVVTGQIDVIKNGEKEQYTKEVIGKNTLLKYDWEKGANYVIHINSRTINVKSPLKPSPFRVISIPLGDVDTYVQQGRSLDTDLSISPSNQYLAIGSYTGKFYLYDLNKNEMMWDISINEGVAKKVIFSDDSKYVFIGEHSVDGNILCFEVSSGSLVWSYTLADDIDRSAPPRSDDPYGIYTLPGVFHFEMIDNKLMVAGLHSWYENGKPKKKSKLYQFSITGEKLWEFPKTEALSTNIQYFSSTNQFTVFTVSKLLSETKETSHIKNESILLLDTKTGKLLDQRVIPPLPPHYPNVAFWQSVSIDKQNQFANMGVYDGRGFIFKINGHRFTETISLELGKPVMVSNIPISAGIPYTNSANEHSIFSVVQTSIPYRFSSANNINEPPALHPAAGTLFFYDKNGKLIWRYKNDLVYSSVHASKTGEWLFATLDNKKENSKNAQFGLTLFEFSNGIYKDVYHYRTQGPAFFRGTISNDGKLLGITENPYVLDDKETIKGTYQVHIVL